MNSIPEKQPGAIVVPGYFNHFVNEVVEKAFEADLNITVGKVTISAESELAKTDRTAE